MCQVALRALPLSDSERRSVRSCYAFTASMLLHHHTSRGSRIDWRVVGKTFGTEPGTLVRFIFSTLKMAINKVSLS